jgi:hypothetical protein
MKISPFLICAIMLLMVCVPALASQQTYEFHHDARMQDQAGGLVKNAYGYVYVATDKKGHGVIRVMFSNGTRLDNARFNAQVRFLDADGGLIRNESFSDRVQAAGADGAAERRLSKLVDLTEFASLQVKFFLSDIPGFSDSQASDPAPVASSPFLRTAYSGN